MTNDVAATILGLDAWFESMRGPLGYGGPVTHWWESSLLYCGPKFDWRYEGVIIGYLNLFDNTGDQFWLERALRAADDVRRAQMPSGNYLNSSFQQGPIEGGTPHEAAVDVGLLELALRLKGLGDPCWHEYQQTAWRNLHGFHIERLWNGHAFRDQPWNRTLVANKNATTLEALLLYQKLCDEDLERYILPTAEFVMSAQVTDHSCPYHGGTVHLGTGRQRLVIGIYTARCASALMRLYEMIPDPRYLRSAVGMGDYLLKLITPDGTHFGHYPDGRTITHPTWISPSGDLLRALLLLQPYTDVPESAISRLVDVLVRYRQPAGGIPTSRGLGRKGATGPIREKLPDFRDVLPVVGWCDKAFRGLTMRSDSIEIKPGIAMMGMTSEPCHWFGNATSYLEDQDEISVAMMANGGTLFSYSKRQQFAQKYKPVF